MRQRPRLWAHATARLSDCDRVVIRTIDQHTNLMTAVIVLGLCSWAILTHHLWFVVLVVLVGAAAYYLGVTVALLLSVVADLTRTLLSTAHGFDLIVTTALFEGAGYLLVARLGVLHRRQRTALQNQRVVPPSHRDHVLPWQVTNHIRTSLAAVRFLLFPVEDERNHQALEQAVEELARLETIFQSIEENPPEQTATANKAK